MLSERKLQILLLMARGNNLEEIARTIGIKRSTVKEHVDVMRLKLCAANAPQLVAQGFALGCLVVHNGEVRLADLV